MIYNDFLILFYSSLSKFSKFKAWKYYQELMNIQWRPYNEIKNIQWQKIKKLIQHAYKNVPFYTDKFKKANITPDDINSEADFIHIPTTNRAELMKESPERITAKNLNKKKFAKVRTSGTTTTPFEVFFDFNAYNRKYALLLWEF